ncbi:hypothetical protein M446_1818 [Methylobacterium sp. 4-46]|uniref:hypothetical protein n=1 Tax=unclassified Methylobacterium TaxID=2615210 RepID=UPI000165C8EF|nr:MULTISPECIES: hypothetical protein [Methylobacterium]ACA16303.1 hypothetical protein M446_1818 [Methylobacterium sp. 4-46]WFT82011.1 hypothetical protein QA634_09185 [Methylobacterium nodulans]
MADQPDAPRERDDLPSIDGPRLTPQGRTAEGGEDATDPRGGAKQGQGDKAEG